MADPVLMVQGRRKRYCTVVANGGVLLDLIVAALNAQTPTLPPGANRGDRAKPRIMGAHILTASAGFTVSNADGTGAIALAATVVPYDLSATSGAKDTAVAGGATLGVEVFLADDPEQSIP